MEHIKALDGKVAREDTVAWEEAGIESGLKAGVLKGNNVWSMEV